MKSRQQCMWYTASRFQGPPVTHGTSTARHYHIIFCQLKNQKNKTNIKVKVIVITFTFFVLLRRLVNLPEQSKASLKGAHGATYTRSFLQRVMRGIQNALCSAVHWEYERFDTLKVYEETQGHLFWRGWKKKTN